MDPSFKIDKQTIKDIIEWDIYNWSRALSFWESFELNISEGKTVLEIGSRNGGLSLYGALRGANVICSDLDGPSSEAKKKHLSYKLNDKVSYKKINGLNINYSSHFDAILFKSVLGGIGRNNNIKNQKKAIKQMHAALKLGGQLLFAENLSSSKVHQLIRNKIVPWSKSWRYVTKDEVADFLKDFNSIHLKTFGIFGTFGRNEYQKNMLGILDKHIFEKMIPEQMNYIIAGVAIK